MQARLNSESGPIRLCSCAARELSQRAGFEQVLNLAELKTATEADGTGFSAVVTSLKGLHLLRRLLQQLLAVAQDWPAIGVLAAGQREQLLEGLLLGLIFALGQLLQDDLPFEHKIVGSDFRLEHQLRQQLTGQRQRLLGHQHVVVHVIKSGGGVADPAVGLHLPIEGTGGELFIAFEHHVFQEMGHAVLLALLNGTAGATPELKTGNGRIGYRQQGQRQTVAQRGGVWDGVAKPCGLIQRIKAADLLTMAILPWVCAL